MGSLATTGTIVALLAYLLRYDDPLYLVAVHHVTGESAERASSLARTVGMTVYEARQRLINTPAVVSLAPTDEEARDLAARLEGAGFRALVLDPSSSPFVQMQTLVRSFEFTEASLVARPRQGSATELPFEKIRLILRGSASHSEVSEKTVKGKKFSVGLAVATGGLVMRKKVETKVQTREDTVSPFVHVYATKGRPLLFSASVLDFKGLGESLKPSRMLNMQVLLQKLRHVAPDAAFDERLMRRTSQAQMLGPGLDPDVDLPLASALLAMSEWATAR